MCLKYEISLRRWMPPEQRQWFNWWQRSSLSICQDSALMFSCGLKCCNRSRGEKKVEENSRTDRMWALPPYPPPPPLPNQCCLRPLKIYTGNDPPLISFGEEGKREVSFVTVLGQVHCSDDIKRSRSVPFSLFVLSKSTGRVSKWTWRQEIGTTQCLQQISLD